MTVVLCGSTVMIKTVQQINFLCGVYYIDISVESTLLLQVSLDLCVIPFIFSFHHWRWKRKFERQEQVTI